MVCKVNNLFHSAVLAVSFSKFPSQCVMIINIHGRLSNEVSLSLV